jgi:heavy metal translocating P-type ATPase
MTSNPIKLPAPLKRGGEAVVLPTKNQEHEESAPEGRLSFFRAEFFLRHETAGRVRIYSPQIQFDQGFAGAVVNRVKAFFGVSDVRANERCGALIVEYDFEVISQRDLLSEIEALKISNEELQIDHTPPKANLPTLRGKFAFIERGLELLERLFAPTAQLIVGGLAFASGLFGLPLLLTRSLLVVSVVPIGLRAFRTGYDENKIGVDALDGMAASLMLVSGRLTEACFMTGLIALGEFIREQTSKRCRKIVDDLLGLSGRNAWLVKGKKRICVPAEEVQVGNLIVIYPGEMVPVDGTVTAGQAAVDQSKLTGEALPVEVDQGGKVYASTVVLEGKIYVICESVGTNTKAGGVLESVKGAPLHETKIQNYASLMADKLVVPIILSAGICFALTRNVVRLMSMLIFDFSTGIRIAAPTAVLSSMHNAGRRGILIKSGAALERLATIDAVVFDKTGTLTLGEPKVTRVVELGEYNGDQLVAYAAAVEQRLHHPASRAIVKAATQRSLSIPERVDSKFIRGMGVQAKVGDLDVLVGSRRLMESENVGINEAKQTEVETGNHAESLAYVAINGKLVGLIAYSDQIRPEASQAIAQLKKLGVKKLVMATGDGEEVAQLIARACGITDVMSRSFPEQKATLVKQLKSIGFNVAVIGDGINDSPALAHADVALSLHGGTEAAREGADIVLTDGDLRRLPEAIKIARSAMELVKQNLSLAMVPNSAGLCLAAVGLVGPAGATLLNNGSAIAAALNSLRPLYLSDSWSKENSK